MNVVRSLSAPAAEENEATCEVSEEVLKKIETVKDGFNRQCAETLTVADLYLMMGMPDKIVLEYEWVERDQNTDLLNLGELTHALRRLIDLAKTQSAELVKSKLASQVHFFVCLCTYCSSTTVLPYRRLFSILCCIQGWTLTFFYQGRIARPISKIRGRSQNFGGAKCMLEEANT